MSEEAAFKAGRYSTIKYSLAIIDTIYLFVILCLFLFLGLSKLVMAWTANFMPLYILVIFLGYYILDFPLNFYRSYTLEHKFSLSRQKLGDWFMDQLKGGVVSYIIGLILIFAFYFVLRHSTEFWWLNISLFWIFFSLGLAKLAPVIIIPLFFKYKKLSDEILRNRIMGLAEKMNVKILDCFEIDFSKKTLKANAAFAGWGNTRRVILADTLKDKYTHDEIEVILAHEFAHYKLKHLIKLILINAAATILLFFLIFKTNAYFLKYFGLTDLADLAALPLIFLYFLIFGIITQPLEAFFSRRFEKDADMLALETTHSKDAFISMMEKLADQNLADKSPHWLIKFFFFDHPPISERINLAKQFKKTIYY